MVIFYENDPGGNSSSDELSESDELVSISALPSSYGFFISSKSSVAIGSECYSGGLSSFLASAS